MPTSLPTVYVVPGERFLSPAVIRTLAEAIEISLSNYPGAAYELIMRGKVSIAGKVDPLGILSLQVGEEFVKLEFTERFWGAFAHGFVLVARTLKIGTIERILAEAGLVSQEGHPELDTSSL